MRIIFAGSSDFAVPIFNALFSQKKHPLVAAITTPDSKKGRGLKDACSPVKLAALTLSAPLWQIESINATESIEALYNAHPDLIIVASFGQKISDSVLEIPSKGCINIHPSLLPKYRGSAPINYALLNGDKKTGISIFRIVKKMDAGPILKQLTVDLQENETAPELSQRLAVKSAELLISLLDEIAENKINLIAQDESKVTFAPKLKKTDGAIDWNKSGRQILNQIRALQAWPGTYSFFHRKAQNEAPPLKVDICQASIYYASNETLIGSTGQIINLDNQGIIVVCGANEQIVITRLKPAGGRILSAREFVNGYRPKIGDYFGKQN